MKLPPSRRPGPSAWFATAAALSAALLPPVLVSAAAPKAPPAFQRLVEDARRIAAAPYDENALRPLPDALAGLRYDGHRDIRSLPAQFLWAGTDLPFRGQFRHPGWLFKEKVELAEVAPHGTAVTDLPFEPERFTYGEVVRDLLNPADLPRDLGYAGLSLHHVPNARASTDPADEIYNEILSIQGGSYFRAVGQGQHWGASVRAVAVDTAEADLTEEFPRWTRLWAQRPEPGDATVTLYGLVEGPSLAGAYQLTLTPGETLKVDVDGRIFLRHGVTKLALAPITSMFLFGEADPAAFGDYRPEVHDSDGLAILEHDDDGGVTETWRPLHNPAGLSVSRFPVKHLRGFGLLQRDRAFTNYEDLETEMQLRPSVWVTPKGDWGPGHVQLVEFGSKLEATDNIGAFWVPDAQTPLALNGPDTPAGADSGTARPAWNRPGGALRFAYTLDFTQDPRPLPQRGGTDQPLLRFHATRTAPAFAHGDEVATEQPKDAPVRFIVDTEPGFTLPGGTPVLAKVSAENGTLHSKPFVQYNRFADSYRVFFDVKPTLTAEGHVPPMDVALTLKGEDLDPETGLPAPDPEFDPAAAGPGGQIQERNVVDGPVLSEVWRYRWEPR